MKLELHTIYILRVSILDGLLQFQIKLSLQPGLLLKYIINVYIKYLPCFRS